MRNGRQHPVAFANRVGALIGLIAGAVLALGQVNPPRLTDADLHFPKTLSPELPFDVDPAKLSAALAEDLKTAASQPPTEELRVPRSQRLFDIFVQ